MRVHIEGNIFISGDRLSFVIEERSMKNVLDKETKEVIDQKEHFEILGNYGTLSQAIKGLLHKKIGSISNETILTLQETQRIILKHKEFIESKIEI